MSRPAFVRESGTASGTATPLVVTTLATPVGNYLIAVIASNRGASAARTVSSITQTNVGWAKITNAGITTGSSGLEIWRGLITVGPAGLTASIAFSGTVASGCAASILEFSGVAIPTIIDAATVTNTGSSVTPAIGAITTNQLDDLLVAAFAEVATAAPSATPWSVGTFVSNTSIGVQGAYQAPSSAKGSQTASWTITSAAWMTLVVGLAGATITTSPVISDSVAVTDLPEAPLVSDLSAVTDSVTIVITAAALSISVSDSSAASDVISVREFDNVSVSDSTGLAEAVTLTVSSPAINLADAVGPTDTVTVSEVSRVSVSDSTAAADVVVALSEVSYVSVSESAAATDVLTVTVSALRLSISDSTGATESVTISGVSSVSASDSTAVADASSLAISTPAISSVDSTGVVESVAISEVSYVSVADSAAVADSGLLTVSSPAPSVSDTSAVADSATLSGISYVTVADGSVPTDAVTLTLSSAADLTFSVSDATGLTEIVVASEASYVSVTDTSAAADAALVDMSTPTVSVSDLAAPTDTIVAEVVSTIDVFDSIAPSDSQTTGYAYSRAITIDHTQVGGSTLTDFPVFVALLDGTLATTGNGGHVQNSNGYDITFFADALLTVPLFWEVELYVETTGQLAAWVKIPSVSSTVDTVFYIAYGNPAISTFQSVASSVWDAYCYAVWHYGDGTGLSLLDSTGNGFNGTGAGSLYVNPGPGSMVGAISLPGGGSNYYTAGSGTDFDWTSNSPRTDHRTWTCWYRFTNPSAFAIPAFLDHGSSGNGYRLLLNQFALNASDVCLFGSFSFGAVPDDTNWHHAALVFDDTTNRLYIDGADTGSPNVSAGFSGLTVSTPTTFLNQANSGDWLVYDECRWATTARTADWILAEYHNQQPASTFLTLEAEVANGGSGPILVVSDPSISVSDSTGVTDAAALSVDISLSVADASGVADAVFAVESNPAVSVADAVAATDSVALLGISYASASDSATVTDAPILAVSAPAASVVDAAGPTDTVVLSLVSYITVADGAGATDAASVVESTPAISVTDSAAVADAPTLSEVGAVNVFDAAGATDADATTVSGPSVVAADAVAATDAASLVVSDPAISVADTAGVFDSVSAFQGGTGIHSQESVGVMAAALVTVSDPQISVADAVLPTDSISVEELFYVHVADTVGVSDADAVAVSAPAVNVSDSTGVAEFVALSERSYVNVSDAAGVADAVEAAADRALSISDSTAASDAVTVVVSAPAISRSDTTTVSDVVAVAESAAVLSASESTAVADTATVYLRSYIEVSDSTAAADAPALSGNSYLTVADSVSPADVVSVTVSDPSISVSDSAGTADTAAAGTGAVLITDTAGVGDSTTIAVSAPAVIVSDSAGVSDAVAAVVLHLLHVEITEVEPIGAPNGVVQMNFIYRTAPVSPDRSVSSMSVIRSVSPVPARWIADPIV